MVEGGRRHTHSKLKQSQEEAPMAKKGASEKREYKTVDSAIRQKAQWEKKGYKVTRRGNVLYLKKG
jgi:hypothetical protein